MISAIFPWDVFHSLVVVKEMRVQLLLRLFNLLATSTLVPAVLQAAYISVRDSRVRNRVISSPDPSDESGSHTILWG